MQNAPLDKGGRGEGGGGGGRMEVSDQIYSSIPGWLVIELYQLETSAAC